ncbi:GINS complex, Sld5 component [Martensiomyces pterosporus]|nr:GINS complex, Sld5 component [Martensiomyces pterosporus]
MDTDDIYSGALDSNLDLYSEPADTQPAQDSDMMDTSAMATEAHHNRDTNDDDPDSYEEREEDEEEDEEEEIMEDDLTILKRAWINERNAPEILEYEGAAIENLMELVDFQTQKMSTQPVLIANILRMDVDRIKYLVRSYLRSRLSKIEQCARHYVESTMYKDRMSQSELDYAKGFVELEERHMRRSFLDQLPPHLRRLDEVSGEGLDMVPKPDLDSAVFCRVRTTVGEFQFEPSEDPIVMKRNNIFITRYSIIRNLVEDGKVELI